VDDGPQTSDGAVFNRSATELSYIDNPQMDKNPDVNLETLSFNVFLIYKKKPVFALQWSKVYGPGADSKDEDAKFIPQYKNIREIDVSDFGQFEDMALWERGMDDPQGLPALLP
jgi:hypothetical protein